jgi:hypothetical protein
MRVYSTPSDDKSGDFKLKNFLADYPFLDLCNMTRIIEVHNITQPIFPATLRFLPLLDPMVDLFVSRDCDTVMTVREVEAVRYWLTNSNDTFHMMRDHPGHCGVEILAGIYIFQTFSFLS